ncbi:hypothetical protein A6A08_01795 [Nocardiopsis sp. TSRI0078]|uniref:vWA domain-containing protein n=1 Tax=unclassified Nocardiopsis TaxID=2649073 RepID=UPI00093A8B7D|nr:VWA domain-containing protein [Nocardiopsis sp. TSRI0078]OKI23537.1 hypothetical protein A6A08_01795 [Nocardiopsis sp. TSRI0078]
MPNTADRATGTAFRIEVDQDRSLPTGGREVHAVVSVTSDAPVATGSSVDAAEVVIVDTSGSMYGERLNAAKRAARAAVETLREGVRFAVVTGHSRAHVLCPEDGTEMARVDAATRAEALAAIGRLRADGGTRMGTWLPRAAELFATVGGGVKHAILLTDGQNNEGVGTGWKVDELRRIDAALLGAGPGIIADPDDMAADFRTMTRASMGKAVADVALRLWTPRNSVVRHVKQVAPTVLDLTGREVERVPQAGGHPTGSWGTESRDYHVCVEVPPGDPGRRLRAGWVRVVLPGADGAQEQVLASGNILAEWTADGTRATEINPRVAHYTGQVELAQAIQDGLAARRGGDDDTATTRLGRAVALAHESGNEETAKLLDRVVDVVDPATGTARLKPGVDKVDEMTLDTDSTRTVRTRPRQNGPDTGGAPVPG